MNDNQDLVEKELKSSEHQESGGDSSGRLQRLAGVLRKLGGGVLLAASAAFLLQGWSDDTSILRYYSFLAFTVGLCAFGFFCGVRLQEDKGARTFLALAAATVPAHYLALGGLAYSRFHTDVSFIPGVVRWVASSNMEAGMAIVIATALLAVVSLIAFSSLARSSAKVATAVYLLSCAAFLCPSRDPFVVSCMSLGLLTFALWADARLFRNDPSMKTLEGSLVRLMIVTPTFLVLARSMSVHGADQLVVGAAFAMVSILLFVLAPELKSEREEIARIQGISVLPASVSVLLLGSSFTNALGLSVSLGLTLISLGFSAVLVVMSLYCVSPGTRYRHFAATVGVWAVLLHLIVTPGLFASVLCLTVALLVSSYGYAMEERGVFLSGLLGTILGTLYHVRYAVDILTISPWVSLAIIGVITLVAASYLEKNYRRLARSLADFRARMAEWK